MLQPSYCHSRGWNVKSFETVVAKSAPSFRYCLFCISAAFSMSDRAATTDDSSPCLFVQVCTRKVSLLCLISASSQTKLRLRDRRASSVAGGAEMIYLEAAKRRKREQGKALHRKQSKLSVIALRSKIATFVINETESLTY